MSPFAAANCDARAGKDSLMIHRNRTQASSLFLLEFILAILFFSIASAVCLQLFTKAHTFSRDAQKLHLAVGECGNAAELFRACGSVEEAKALIAEQYPLALASSEEDLVTLCFDGDMLPCAASQAVNLLLIRFSQDGRMLNAEIQMMNANAFHDSEDLSANQAPIYKLTVRHYIPRRVDYAN